MNKAKAVLCFVLLPASALLAQGPRGGGPGGPGGPMGRGPGRDGMMGVGPAVVTGAPYSGVEVVQSQETFSDGNVIQRKRQTNVFRDSVGRVRTEETITPDASTGKAPYTRITILDYVGGHRYELNSSTMTGFDSPLHIPHTPPGGGGTASGTTAGSGTASPMAVRRGGATGTTDPSRPNVTRITLNPQSVNGVMASGIQHTETIPAGAIGNARTIQTSRIMWVSNDLKVPVQIRSSDPRFGNTDMELTQIVTAEPNASLFVVPAGYTLQKGAGRGGPGGPGRPGPQGMRGPRPPAPPQ